MSANPCPKASKFNFPDPKHPRGRNPNAQLEAGQARHCEAVFQGSQAANSDVMEEGLSQIAGYHLGCQNEVTVPDWQDLSLWPFPQIPPGVTKGMDPPTVWLPWLLARPWPFLVNFGKGTGKGGWRGSDWQPDRVKHNLLTKSPCAFAKARQSQPVPNLTTPSH
jgi:hypothetical protein